jgi:hypothetical protein
MFQRVRLSIFFVVLFGWMTFAFAPCAQAQTLGGITGTVTDASGAAVVDAVVTLVGDQTTLTRTQKTNSSGSYEFVNLPIGTYTLTFTHDAFQTQRIPSITVQADRTATVNAALKVGQVSTTVTVEETPLVNAVDTTPYRQLHGPRYSIAGRKRGAYRRRRRQHRPRKPANLGQRPARYKQHFPVQWS